MSGDTMMIRFHKVTTVDNRKVNNTYNYSQLNTKSKKASKQFNFGALKIDVCKNYVIGSGSYSDLTPIGIIQ